MKSLIASVFCTFLVAVYSDESNSKLLSTKIIGGQDARPQNNGHVVIIARHEKYIATGALVSTKNAITNGHAVEDIVGNLSDVIVVPDNPDDENTPLYYIKNIVLGEKYNCNELFTDDNYAIICLIEPVKLTDRVKVIPLSPNYVIPGTEAYVAGWGSTSLIRYLWQAQRANTLKELRVKIISNEKCVIGMKHQLSSSQMCARAATGLQGSPYIGDVGDPLVNDDGELIGLVNSVHRFHSFDATYIRISASYQHIMSIISQQEEADVISLPPHEELCESDK